MAKISGLSHESIARELHLSHLTVKKHMAVALKSIRKYLQKYIAR
jgi:DNA-directed RNA polymerase specialized sigma24 family protein